jgi:hypothetical protein
MAGLDPAIPMRMVADWHCIFRKAEVGIGDWAKPSQHAVGESIISAFGMTRAPPQESSTTDAHRWTRMRPVTMRCRSALLAARSGFYNTLGAEFLAKVHENALAQKWRIACSNYLTATGLHLCLLPSLASPAWRSSALLTDFETARMISVHPCASVVEITCSPRLV